MPNKFKLGALALPFLMLAACEVPQEDEVDFEQTEEGTVYEIDNTEDGEVTETPGKSGDAPGQEKKDDA